jgi:putative transposase
VRARPISNLCRIAGISRQGFYQLRRVRQRQALDEEAVVQFVRRERIAQPRLGARKLHHHLKCAGQGSAPVLGRDRFFSVLRRHDLLVKPKTKSVRTTYYDTALPVYRNLLYQLEPTAPHQVWVSDITYIATAEAPLYLSLITDLYSRQIVGWHLSDTLMASESIKALKMAIDQLPAGRWPIHHSDRGSQYCCHDYVAVLNERNLPISMTEQNHCYENAYAERVNGILKQEYHLDLTFRSVAQVHRAVAQAIWQYNHRRPHLSLRMQTPAQVHTPDRSLPAVTCATDRAGRAATPSPRYSQSSLPPTATLTGGRQPWAPGAS